MGLVCIRACPFRTEAGQARWRRSTKCRSGVLSICSRMISPFGLDVVGNRMLISAFWYQLSRALGTEKWITPKILALIAGFRYKDANHYKEASCRKRTFLPFLET